MIELRVSVATHHFVVSGINPRARPAVDDFARSLIQWSWRPQRRGPAVRVADKVYAASTRYRNEHRFHINLFEKFKEHLKRYHINDTMVHWSRVPLTIQPEVGFELASDAVEPRDYQVPVIDYIVRDEGPRSRLVDLQTGKGKTFCALRSIFHYNKRAVAILKPKYITQWVNEIKKAYNIKNKEVCAIYGKNAGNQLISLLNMAAQGDLPYKFIVISNAVYRNWIRLYELHYTQILDMGYPCLPQDFFAHVRAGIRLIDEVHEDFHFNFKLDLYTNVERSLSLSATLLSDNPFVANMMKVAYPFEQRYIGGEYDKYVKSYYLMYKFRNPEKIKTNMPGNSSYSHFAFEESIIKQPKVLENYFIMHRTFMEETYIRNYLPGQRCLFYFASIDMCTRFVNWLKQHYPRKDIRRFVEDDADEDIKEAEISVSTVGSAGTGLDIPMLATVILSHMIRSTQGNVQGFGRLRKPKDGWTPEFGYVVCEDIIKHIDYHEEKDRLLAGRALSNEKRYYMSLI